MENKYFSVKVWSYSIEDTIDIVDSDSNKTDLVLLKLKKIDSYYSGKHTFVLIRLHDNSIVFKWKKATYVTSGNLANLLVTVGRRTTKFKVVKFHNISDVEASETAKDTYDFKLSGGDKGVIHGQNFGITQFDNLATVYVNQLITVNPETWIVSTYNLIC